MTSKRKATAFVSRRVKLFSIKDIFTRKDKFTLHYQVLPCLNHSSLTRLPIFEIISEYVY